MKYFLVVDKKTNLSKLVYADSKFHALSLVRHLFNVELSFNDFIIKQL